MSLSSSTILLCTYHVYNFYNFCIVLNILLSPIHFFMIIILKYQILAILNLISLNFISTYHNIPHISHLSLTPSIFSSILFFSPFSFINTIYIFTNLPCLHFLIFFLSPYSLISSLILYYLSIYLYYFPHPVYSYTNNPIFFIFPILLSYLLYNICVHILSLFYNPHNYISIYIIFSFLYILLSYICFFLYPILLCYCLCLCSKNKIFSLLIPNISLSLFTIYTSLLSLFAPSCLRLFYIYSFLSLFF